MSVTQKQLEEAIERSATYFQERYLDFVNNFLTMDRYAEYYGISVSDAKKEIEIGNKIHKQRTK